VGDWTADLSAYGNLKGEMFRRDPLPNFHGEFIRKFVNINKNQVI
jgi:hypothetical protein